jgi:hypothetical protein
MCSLVFTSSSGQKTPAPGKKISLFKVEALPLFLILKLRMNISYYVCGKPTQYQCEYLLFLSMDSGFFADVRY